MKKDKTPNETPDETPATVLSFKVNAHLNEGGSHYKPGDAIELSPERAAALGALVSAVEAE